MTLTEGRETWPLLMIVALLLAGGRSSLAQDEGAESQRQLTLTALGEYDGFFFLDRNEADLYNGRNAVRFLPDAELELSPMVAFEGALELRKDFSDSSRSRVFLDKGFLDLHFEAWDLRVGRQTIAGGRTSVLKPTDSFMRHDYTDFVQAEEEPIDAVKIDRYSGDWTIEGVWAPVFTPDLFPIDSRNRWTGRALGQVTGASSPGRPLVVEVDHSSEPPKDLSSSQLGVRVTRRSGGVDWSASYYWGYDRLPTYIDVAEPTLDPSTGGATIVARRFYERIQIAGVDGETFLGPWGLRGEAGYTLTSSKRTQNPRIDDPYLRLVLGVDRTWSRIVSTHDLYLNGQFLMDEELPAHGPSNHDLVDVRLRHFFQYAVTGELEYRFSQFRVLRSQAFFNVEDHDYVVQLEFRWQPRDAMTWTFGADLIGGPDGSFFGLYRRNDRLRVNLEVYLPRWQRRSRVVEPPR